MDNTEKIARVRINYKSGQSRSYVNLDRCWASKYGWLCLLRNFSDGINKSHEILIAIEDIREIKITTVNAFGIIQLTTIETIEGTVLADEIRQGRNIENIHGMTTIVNQQEIA